MDDPLSDIIAQLRPRTVFAKRISGAGRWGVRYEPFGQPSFCVVLEGRCRLAVSGQPPVVLEVGDFVLLPATPGFVLSGFERVAPRRMDPRADASGRAGEIRHGTPTGRPDVRLLGGYFAFDAPESSFMVSLLPALVHVRGETRLARLVQLLGEETRHSRAGRELVLQRLVEILLIEALRAAPAAASPGLLRGLGDPRLAPALRQMHRHVAKPWTVSQLARASSLSRSAFFERFARTVGVAPMTYLTAWRMALARELLRHQACAVAEVAERVGYASGSAFATAFRRHVGCAPGRYAREPLPKI